METVRLVKYSMPELQTRAKVCEKSFKGAKSSMCLLVVVVLVVVVVIIVLVFLVLVVVDDGHEFLKSLKCSNDEKKIHGGLKI